MKLVTIYPIDEKKIKFGGIESCIRDYINFSPDNFEMEIVGISKRNSLKPGRWYEINFGNKKCNFFPVISVVDPNKRALIPLMLQFCFGLLRWKHKIDFNNKILVFHRIEPAYLLKDIKTPKVLFVHGDIKDFYSKYCESRWRKIRHLYFLIEPFFISQFHKIFVVSRKGTEYYKNRYSKYSSRFIFLPTWYNPEIFYHKENIEKQNILYTHNIPNKTPLILFVGRLELPKDPILTIESFYYILKEYPDALLLIVGEGSLKERIIKRIEELNISKNVIFLGIKTQQEIAELMNISDVLLLTSAFEGMPYVVLESLACGLPVVSTDVGEVSLVVKDGISGKLVRSRSPADIAKATIEVLNSHYSPTACQETISHYCKEKVFSFLFDELRKLVDEKV